MILTDLVQIWALKNNASNPWDIYSSVELDARIEREVLVAEIIRRCGSLEPVYNTTDTFTFFNDLFFKREKDNIKRMLDLKEMEYNPLENFERVESLHKKSEGKTILDEDATSNRQGKANDEGKVSAYNEDIYQPSESTSSSSEDKYIDTRDYTRSNDFESTDTNNIHGINGLVTRQDLIEKERKLIAFNVVKWIVDKYCCEYFYQVF